VRVAPHQVGTSRRDELPAGSPHLGPRAADEARHDDLQPRATCLKLVEQVDAATGGEPALRVREHRHEAFVRQPLGDGGRHVARQAGHELDEEEPARDRPRRELLALRTQRALGADLGSEDELEVDADGREVGPRAV
jgi:hypothetical protein